MDGITLIAKERKEQIEKHGRTLDRDILENDNEQLALGALMLIAAQFEEGIDPEEYPDGWDKDICEKMLNKPYKERLVIAGALVAAEIDRLNGPALHEIDASPKATPLDDKKSEFDKALTRLGDLYEEAKDCLHSMSILSDEMTHRDRLYEILVELRDKSAMQLRNIYAID